MESNDVKFQIEVKERLTAIETLLKQMDFHAVEKVADEALAMAKKNGEDIEKLQSTQTWVIRSIIGAILAAIMGFILVK